MKILHIIPNLKRGGAERLVIDILSTLSLNPTIKLKLVLFENKIEYAIDKLASIIEVVPARVQLSVLKSNSYDINALQTVIQKFDPDIIHTHLFETEIISRTCLYPKAKWFSHAHDRMQSLKKLTFSLSVDKRMLTNYFERKYLIKRYKKNGGNQYIAISKDIESFLKSVLPRHNRNIHRLENAIDIDRFKNPRTTQNELIEGPIKLISVGRLDANKNHQFLLHCVNILKERGIDVHLTIVGEGDQRVFLERETDKLNLRSEVSLAGIKDNVEQLLWQSDLYVHSAFSEGFGLTILEAMASGLPVVTLDGGGNKDLILEGINGFLIEDRDPVKFADQIAYLWREKNRLKEMGLFAQTFAQQFSIENYCKKLLEIYKNALSCAE